MKILILISTMIFSLTAFAETEAGAFLPGCKECVAMLKPGKVKLSTANKCKTKGCKDIKGSSPSTAPVVEKTNVRK